MKLKQGVSLRGVSPFMLYVIAEAETIWTSFGRKEGVTITSTTEGKHMPNSKHYQGCALDLRIHYWDIDTAKSVAQLLYQRLMTHSPDEVCFQVILEPDHIHVEIDDVYHLKFLDPVEPLPKPDKVKPVS